MLENETVEELDTTVTEEEVATSTEDNEEEDTTSDDEITYDQALAWKKSLEKANKKIAILEKGKKTEKVETPAKTELSEDALDALLEKRDFYKNNVQAKELREEIEAMVSASKGKVDREKAFAMLSGDAEIEENRKVYSKPIVNGGKVNESGFTPISIDKYDKLSASEQKTYNEKSKAKNGGVVFK